MEFIEAPAFTRMATSYLSDDDYRGLQTYLVRAPGAGDVMPGTGGFRKVRWADRKRGKGRRGGLRVIYYYFEAEQQIWLITLYGKNEMEELSAGQKRELREAIERECAARESMRRRR